MNKGLAAIYSPLPFLGKISTFGVNRYLGLTGNGGLTLFNPIRNEQN